MLLSIHLSSSGQYMWNNTTTSVRYNIFKSFLVRWPSFKGLCQWQSTKILVIYHKTTFCLVPLRPFAWTNTHFPLVGTTLIGYRLDDNFLTFFVWKVEIKDILKLNYSKKGICLTKNHNSTFHFLYLRWSACFENVCTLSVNTFDLNA